MSTILPQNMNQSLVPLPLRASRYQQDPMISIERRAKHIQRNLQRLIDAQSEGLLAGLGGQRLEGSVSNESHGSFLGSPSPRGASTMPVRQPPTKKIGLRAAREGIFTSMYDLLRLREEEQELLTLRLEEREYGLHEIETFKSKRSELESSISAINGNRDSQRSKELREEGLKLESEIHELENKLSQMKARHRFVAQELSQVENTVEAKLSSYKESLSLLDLDIRKFLKSPPVNPPEKSTAGESFYSLKSSRRTIEMAREHWKREQSEIQHRQREVTTELQALDEGCGLWKEVVADISGFEKRLKATMRQSIQSQSQLLQQEASSSNNTNSGMIRGIMEDLSRTTDSVGQSLDYAEERDWKLLVCCISAELEALREARGLLLSVFNASEDDCHPTQERNLENRNKDTDSHSHSDPLGVDDSEPLADLLRDVRSRSPEPATKSEDEEEDDEPDPAWLLPES
ncbi:hypothetical protein BJX64DRAFT_34799 [Aspergillus heterothallicus]